VIHEPDKSVGYYGADVSGPVFKSIAQKIFITSPIIDELEGFKPNNEGLDKEYDKYFAEAQKTYNTVPNVQGMSGMDAVAILENLGLEVETIGNGRVKKQSVTHGTELKKVQKIVLEL
jgi:cell division protein FtsI (penicillin-binding protein 3)